MVVFVFVFNLVQNQNGLLNGGRFYHHLLKTPFQSAVFFYILSVFVQGGGSNALDLPTGQCRFEHIGGIQTTGGASRTHDCVQLVYKENDVAVFFKLGHNSLHALFKLSAVFGARHKTGQIQGNYPFAVEDAGNFLLVYSKGKAFRDGGFSHTGLSDQ